jgi:hypothetical protein
MSYARAVIIVSRVVDEARLSWDHVDEPGIHSVNLVTNRLFISSTSVSVGSGVVGAISPFGNKMSCKISLIRVRTDGSNTFSCKYNGSSLIGQGWVRNDQPGHGVRSECVYVIDSLVSVMP